MKFENPQWSRVTKENPCNICKKPDWCTYSSNGAFCCMRVKSGKSMKSGGWLHLPGGEVPKYVPPIKPAAVVAIDAQAMWSTWFKDSDPKRLMAFAATLGVEPMSLLLLGCCWAPEHQAWAFPMKNHLGKVIGIRLRNESGQKWSVKGSKQGLFIPKMDFNPLVLITEGPTDCAAALTLGFVAIGRPSCLGCEEMVSQLILERKIKSVVIVSDTDGPGMAGADRLQESLKVPSLIFLPPAKDIRKMLQEGASREVVESIIKGSAWHHPKK